MHDSEKGVLSNDKSEDAPSPIPDSQRGSVTVTAASVASGESPEPKSIDFPEGGLQAWLTVAGSWMVQICTFGYLNSFAVYQDYYVRFYLTEFTSSQISWIGSVQLLFILATGAVTGRAFDRGYFYHLTICGAILFSFCLFMLSLAKPEQYYQVFLSQGLGVGIASGIMYVPSVGVLTHYFNKKRPVVMAIVASGSSLGSALHPIMLNQLFHNPNVGFAKGVRASAGLNLGLLTIACLLMRTRLPAKKHGGMSMWMGLKTFAQDSAYMATVLGMCLTTLGLYFPVFFIQLNSIARGLNQTFSFYSVTILNFAAVFGRLTPILIARRFGVLNLLTMYMATCSVLMFALFGVKTIASTTVFAILFGFFSGGQIALIAPVLSAMANDFSEIGARIGIALSVVGLFGLVGSPIAGALLTPQNIYWRPIVFSGIVVGAGSVALFVGRNIAAKRRGTRIV